MKNLSDLYYRLSAEKWIKNSLRQRQNEKPERSLQSCCMRIYRKSLPLKPIQKPGSAWCIPINEASASVSRVQRVWWPKCIEIVTAAPNDKFYLSITRILYNSLPSWPDYYGRGQNKPAASILSILSAILFHPQTVKYHHCCVHLIHTNYRVKRERSKNIINAYAEETPKIQRASNTIK